MYIVYCISYTVSFILLLYTAEPIGPKFGMGPHVTVRMVYEWSKFQKFVFKSFFLNLYKIFKMREKILWNPQIFCFILYKRRYSQVKPQLKLNSWNRSRRGGAWKPSLFILCLAVCLSVSLYPVYCILYIVYCIFYIVYYKLYTVYCILNIVYCI